MDKQQTPHDYSEWFTAMDPASKTSLDSLSQIADPIILDTFLSHTNIQQVRKTARHWFITRSSKMPDREFLETFRKHKIKPHKRLFGYRVLEQGFINRDPAYARLSIEYFDLPLPRIMAAIPTLIALVTPQTAEYLSQLIRIVLNDEPSFRGHRLMSIAWGDACPKLMSCLTWLGMTPYCEAQNLCPSGQIGEQMKQHAATLSTAHDIIDLHHTYPTLADLLISELPTSLIDEDDDDHA
jgi:hypothetical protein